MNGFRGGRTIFWFLLFAGLVSICALALWTLPSLLTRHPSAGMNAAERLKAANDVRGPLAAILVALGTAGTVVLAARTFILNREGQVTERYTRAVDQIGAEALEVRVGGIYALERIGRDSRADRPTVIFVLGALVRHRSHDQRGPDKEPPEDVYAALSVINRLAPKAGVVVNLAGADLRNARLEFMHRVKVILQDSRLTGASIPAEWAAAPPRP